MLDRLDRRRQCRGRVGETDPSPNAFVGQKVWTGVDLAQVLDKIRLVVQAMDKVTKVEELRGRSVLTVVK
jgi:hypothetical protein